MFGAIFGVELGGQRFSNVNTDANGPYPISRDIKRAIDLYRAQDIELYRRAVEIFKRQAIAIAA
jgi:hypothetical protein